MLRLVPLDEDPWKVAEYFPDSQMQNAMIDGNRVLMVAAHRLGYSSPFDVNLVGASDKYAIWASATKWAFEWTVQYCKALHMEFMLRRGKIPAAWRLAVWAEHLGIPRSEFKNRIPEGTFYAKVPQDIGKKDTIIEACRAQMIDKERQLAARRRASILACVALGKPDHSIDKPIATWSPPRSRPSWMPARVPAIEPTELMREGAKRWASEEAFAISDPRLLMDDEDAFSVLITLAGW